MIRQAPRDYRYARDLVEEIRAYGGFSIGRGLLSRGACGVPQSERGPAPLEGKGGLRVDFLVTQMFFDNSALYSFLYRAQQVGITVPVLAESCQ